MLLPRLRSIPISQGGGIFACKAVVGELWAIRIASWVSKRTVGAIDREESQTIATQKPPHAFHIVIGGQERAGVRRIDPVIVGMFDRRAGDPHMDFFGAALAHHGDDFCRGGAADDAVVDQHNTLALDADARRRIVLELHAKLANALLWLDEGPPDIVIADDAKLEGQA